MNIFESDQLITGASMAQETQSVDPLHLFADVSDPMSAEKEAYPFTNEEVKIGRLFINKIGSMDRVVKLLDYLGEKDAEYKDIAEQNVDIIQDIASSMPDDYNSLDMQGYMNMTTNPSADGSPRAY